MLHLVHLQRHSTVRCVLSFNVMLVIASITLAITLGSVRLRYLSCIPQVLHNVASVLHSTVSKYGQVIVNRKLLLSSSFVCSVWP